MQKDFHYYMTFALAVKAGIEFTQAKAIAWANQFVDDCKDFGKYCIRTMVDINWKGRDCFVPEVQRSVFVPFHFLPGNKDSLIVEPDSELARKLLYKAVESKDPIALGMALHSFQDSFSHQYFTGVRDNNNAKHKWDLTSALAPRIGHAEFGHDPDIIGCKWSGPDGYVINLEHFKEAAIRTFDLLYIYSDIYKAGDPRKYIESELKDFWETGNYDKRKKWLMDWAGIGEAHRYSCFTPPDEYIRMFVKAAKGQQKIVMNYIN